LPCFRFVFKKIDTCNLQSSFFSFGFFYLSLIPCFLGAQEILDTMKVAAILIKGGHLDDDNETALSYSQDYFLSRRSSSSISSNNDNNAERRRLCDGSNGVWLRCRRISSTNTHGTGCTLSSSIAATLALGRQKGTTDNASHAGSNSAIDDVLDACCLAKAYVTAGIERGIQVCTSMAGNT
jgi:hypothetical protein